MFFKIGVLKNFTYFIGKHQCWSIFLIKRLQHRCFPVKFVIFIRTPFFTEHHLRWLLPNKPRGSPWYIAWRSDALVIYHKSILVIQYHVRFKNGLRMRNFQGSSSIWTRTHREIFKSALVYL